MRNSDRPKPPRSSDPASRRFALARDLIQRNRRQDSLGVLDKELKPVAGGKASPRRQAKVAALVGDYEKKRGHFSAAAEYYAAAAGKLDSKETREWFRPTLGQIRALIAQPAVDEAFTVAKNAWIRAKASVKEFDTSTNISVTALQAQGRIEIGPRPLRPSVVASRLGEAFLQAGEWEMAEFFFQEALLVNPNGGCRARQALAKIALAAGREGDGEARASEALLLGKYRAKTLSAWPLLISSRARLGKPLFTPQDRSGLRAIQSPSVRARAVLVICKAIRPHDDTWMELATDWVAEEGEVFPAIRFELEKLMRAEARLAGVISREQAALALQHARTKGASPAEAISAGKAYVRTLLLTGAKKAQWELVTNHLERRYGKAVATRATHAMALGAMEANRYDLARSMLDQVRASVPPTRVQWMKSTWALARMETVLSKHEQTYILYTEMAQNPAVPARFRAQALLRALRAAQAGELEIQSVDIAWLENLVLSETDYKVLLDLGRQFNIAGGSFLKLRDQAADRADEMAEIKLREARHPAKALTILLDLNRRQLYDFGHARRVVARFNTYAITRLDWLWSTSLSFWEWYGIVVRSIGREGSWEAGLASAAKYLDDPGTPSEGRGLLAVGTGLMLVSANQHAKALLFFTQATQASPDAISSGAAYYWISVAYLVDGDLPKAKSRAEMVRRCYKSRPALAEEWRYDAQAALILHDKNINAVCSDSSNTYTPGYLKKQKELLGQAILRFSKSK